MLDSHYYLSSYVLLFLMAGVVVFPLFIALLFDSLNTRKTRTAKSERYITDYGELLDIIQLEQAKPGELELAARSFLKYFAELPERTSTLNPDKMRLVKNRLEFVRDFAAHENVSEETIVRFREALYEKAPDYRADFEQSFGDNGEKKAA